MTMLALRKQPSSSQILARMLDTPHLAAHVQALPAAALAKLIDRIGLEDAGELVAFATTEQLARVFDLDLWRSDRPGEDERFDADRFLVWLEVMLESGDAFVAQKLAELPQDLVTLAFHRHVLVLEIEAIHAEIRGSDEADADALEKALSNCLSEELDDFYVVARRHEGWDAILAALVALDRDHHDVRVRILERCASMSAEVIEENGGLYEVLTSEDMLESDVAADREDRRAEAGHVAPSAAAAFLKLARSVEQPAVEEHDALTRAYFRDLRRTPVEPAPERGTGGNALLALLRESDETTVERAPLLLAAGDAGGDHAAVEPLLIRAMRRLAQGDHQLFVERSEEIAYLANVLAEGQAFRGRRLRPVESVRAAVAACSLGLEIAARTNASAKDVEARAEKALREHPADGLFRLAWRKLHEGGAAGVDAFLEAVFRRAGATSLKND